jgi:hypothetical protein
MSRLEKESLMKDDVKVDNQDKRAEWVAPTIIEWDVVDETKLSTSGSGSDGGVYS